MNPSIGIIGGKGRMGRLFTDFFKERGVKVLVSDINTKLSNEELASNSDIVIISVPIDKTQKVIKEVLPHIKKGSAIMDFTSVKEKPVKEMLKGKCEVLGMHPMFGNSNPIPGQTVILCSTRKSGKWSEWMEKFLKNNRAKVHKMSPKEHDKVMSVAQGLIHFADITFADALNNAKLSINDLLKYTSRASELKIELAARLIDQDAGLYGNIQLENPYTLKALKEYQKSVDKLIKIVKRKNLQEFKKYFEKNKKELSGYSRKAYEESSYLIDKMMENRRKPQKKKEAKPGKKDLALLGPKNTYSDIAADKFNKEKLKKYYTRSIDEVFELVEKGTVAMGIVPIENKVQGTVRETLDALFYKNVHIIKELNIPIHHALILLPNSKKADIKTVISHSQALNQCKKFLKKNFPKAELRAYPSTAAATEKMIAANDKSIAVIAPKIAAQKNNLKILKENIEDETDNSTTFIVIKKGSAGGAANRPGANKESKKASIAFYFKADSPGTLFGVFKDFAEAKVNMTKIESRPTKAKFGEYIFYLDFDGGLHEPKIKKLLASVEKKVAKLKILGAY